MCWVLWNSKHLKCLKITRKEYWGLTRCNGNSILDINIPFTVLHRPCFYIILMKFEANWVKVRCWIQSILKMTHFLLPVGGAITLPHNCHIDAIGFIHNKPLKCDQNQTMYVDFIRHFLSLNSRHKFIASPRANRSRYQKSLRNLASPMSWDLVHRVWCSCVENPGRSISNSRACAF